MAGIEAFITRSRAPSTSYKGLLDAFESLPHRQFSCVRSAVPNNRRMDRYPDPWLSSQAMRCGSNHPCTDGRRVLGVRALVGCHAA